MKNSTQHFKDITGESVVRFDSVGVEVEQNQQGRRQHSFFDYNELGLIDFALGAYDESRRLSDDLAENRLVYEDHTRYFCDESLGDGMVQRHVEVFLRSDGSVTIDVSLENEAMGGSDFDRLRLAPTTISEIRNNAIARMDVYEGETQDQ